MYRVFREARFVSLKVKISFFCLYVIHDIVFLNLGNAFNLNDCAVARGEGLKTRARGHRLRKEINVGLVHSGEILHIGNVDIVFDDLLEGRAGQLEDLLEVLENGPLGKTREVSKLLLYFSNQCIEKLR